MDFNYELSFQKAKKSDCGILFEWVNETETRRQSFQSRRITSEEHNQWFQNALKDERIQLLILYLSEKPVGSIRFSIEGSSAVLSYSIDRGYRGCGLGKELIKMASDYGRESLGLLSLRAVTKLDNIASQKVLLENGFLQIERLSNQKGLVFSKDLTLDVF